MLRTYFIDGDKGGVGKSTVARAVCDMLRWSQCLNCSTFIPSSCGRKYVGARCPAQSARRRLTAEAPSDQGQAR